MTWKEAAELAMIEQNVTLNPPNKCVRIRYTTKGDPNQMKDNRGQAMGCAVALEWKLLQNKTREIHNAKFEGYVDRGVFKKLSENEMEAWK